MQPIKDRQRQLKRATSLEGPLSDDGTKRRLLTIHEAATYLGVSPSTLYNGVAPRSLKPFPVQPKRIGKLVRFDIRDLEAYVDSLGSNSMPERKM